MNGYTENRPQRVSGFPWKPKSQGYLAMYEGKNIHYSLVDQKPLCSFSGKICNQRRLNKYGFCVRHILEDPYAPFKRCAYVAKSSRQTCTQPIPKNEEREYCNNHMQVLGMLPKKERKTKKEKDRPFPSTPVSSQPGQGTELDLQHSHIKRRLTVGGFKTKLAPNKNLSSEDVDDVYAFPADSNEKNQSRASNVSTITSIPVPDVSLSNSSNVQFCSYSSKSPTDASSGSSSLAKIYPELAEKLEKIKPRVETKVKGKVKSSRTMNSLQTKIAQNKIKDKLKRNQCSSNASSQSQSPSHSFSNASSPGYHVGTSSPSVVVSLPTSSVPQSRPLPTPPASFTAIQSATSKEATHSHGNSQITDTKPSLSQLNLLNSINLHSLNLSLAQLGLPVPAVSDIEQTLQQLLKSANIPLDGANLLPDVPADPPAQSAYQPLGAPSKPVAAATPHDLAAARLPPPFTTKDAPPPPYSSVHHQSTETYSAAPTSNLSHVAVKAESAVLPSGTESARPGQHIATSASRTSTSSVPISPSSAPLVVPVSTPPSLSAHLKHLSSSSSVLSSVSSSPLMSSSTARNNIAAASDKLNAASTPQSQQKSKVPRAKVRSRNPSVATKRAVPVFTLPMTLVKPRKVRKLTDKTDLKISKCKSAITYCDRYDKKRRFDHNLIISGFDSSDESDVSDCDMLSWQPDWFRASSDEEAGEEDESDYDLRTTKLALTRARLRRQCFQGRGAYRANTPLCKSELESTSALINLTRGSQRAAVRCVNHVLDKPQHKVDKYKVRGLEKRKCLYRNNDEVQCTGVIVPYTNHCIKHVMYNVDQQLFEYCTAKFADNTQCCHPVIDVKHELPLCIEHGLKADNFLKTQDAEPKPKKPRKKTKPSALTRPPKKGKKKKNQRKTVRPQKPLLPEEPSVSETEDDHNNSGTQDEGDDAHDDNDDDDDDDDDKDSPSPSPAKSPTMTKMAALRSAPPPMRRPLPVVRPEVKGRGGPLPGRAGTGQQLEELENLTALTELDNVKMFGDLPLETASKLLEENDFQEVLNRLPDEAFDLFSNTGNSLPSNKELEELEKSLVMANRELKFAKDSFDQFGDAVSPAPQSQAAVGPAAQSQAAASPAPLPQVSVSPASLSQPQQPHPPLQQHHPTQQAQPQSQPSQQLSSLPPILDDADELTRQIAEEILKHNIGSDTSMSSTMCNGDAQESIKAIARSLSTSGMMLSSEANQRPPQPQRPEFVSSPALSRSQSVQGYGNLGKLQNPPNVMVQNIQQPQSQASAVQLQTVSNTISLSQGAVTLPAPGQVPHNVTITPQGIFQSQLPVASSMFAVAANAPPSSTAFSGATSLPASLSGTASAGIISFPSSQQLSNQQLSQLVQQATLQLPPLPPYTPPSQPSQPSQPPSQHSQPPPASTPQKPPVTSAAPTPPAKPAPGHKTLTQEQITHQQQQIQQQQQELARQQEQLTQQQHLLTQQLLQQQLAHLTRQGHIAAGQAGKVAVPGLPQGVSISALLQPAQMAQLGKMNPHLAQAVPGIAQIPHTGKSANVTSAVNTSANLPTTNIIWTAPPNVTITTPNGIPRSLAQPIATTAKQAAAPLIKASPGDAYIDLTESSEPPPYCAAQQIAGQARPPLTSLGSQTLTTTVVTGKS